MKKYAECNAREKKAWKNIKNAAADYIFGLMNGCFDNDKNSISYRNYKEGLEDYNGLVEIVYNEALTNIYFEGGCYFGDGAEAFLKDIRFCGKEFLMEVTEHFVKKYQAEALAGI